MKMNKNMVLITGGATGIGLVEPRLKLLGSIRIAQMIGCPF